MIATSPPFDAIQETSLRQIHDFAARIPVLKTLGFRLTDVQRGFVFFEGHVTEGLTQNEFFMEVFSRRSSTPPAPPLLSRSTFRTPTPLPQGFRSATCDRSKRVLFRAEGRCIKSGKNLLFSEASVHDSSGELLATASSQLMRIGPPALQHISILAKIKEMEE
jgi:acyl-coenzyme A thioesterase PaaI-like protein